MGTYLSSVRKLSLVVVMMSGSLIAQTGLGVVTGRVEDPSKGSVGNAAVTLTDTQRGDSREGRTNDSGLYYFGSLPIGQYHMKVSAPGFETWETDFKVEAGATVTVDPNLLVGQVQATVDVQSAAPLIETEGAALSDVKTANEIHDLPLNGRLITNLFTLTAGVEAGQNPDTQTTPLTPRTNGMPTGSTQILLDGQSYRDAFGGGMSRVQPGLDSVQEYRVETSGSDATLDNPATVELVTRSGTNEFHGGAYETFRDNYGGLVARQVQDQTNTPPKYIRNEFGGFVGGPIKKNKTFFFYDQELMKLRQEVTANTSVPTAANWAGDFSNKVDAQGDVYTIYNPFTTTASGVRQPFAGNKIPTSMIDNQLVSALQAVTPKPSPAYASVNPFLNSNFYTTYPLDTNTNSITARGDQIFSDRDTLSFRMTRSTYDYLQTGGHYGYPAPAVTNATGTSSQNSDIWNATAHYTHTFSATMVNDLQLGAMISMNHQGTNSDSVPWDGKLGFPNPFGATGWPTVSLGEYNFSYPLYDPFEGGAWDNDNPKYQNLTQYQAEDNLSWVRGKHTLKFGFKFRDEFNNVTEAQQAQGSETFDLQWTALWDKAIQGPTPYTGSDLASLELGIPDYLSAQYNHGFFYFRQKEYAGYGQDTWRLGRNLTVTAGLRWEFWTPYHEKYDRFENLNLNELISNPSSMQVIFPGNTTINDPALAPASVIQSWEARGLTGVSANSAHFASNLIPNVWNDFAPRIAVAYSPQKDWVVRGGYGIYYFPMPLSQILQSLRSNPPLNLRFVNNVGQNNQGNIFYSMLDNPNPGELLSGVGGTANVMPIAPNGPASFLAFDTNSWNDNRVQEWTFAIERQFWNDFVLRLAYTGNHGSNLAQSWDFNAPLSQYNYQLQNGIQPSGSTILGTPSLRQPNPNWLMTGLDGVVRHNGYSNSNTFQVTLEKRLSHGLTFSWFYAYTHDMATNDPDGYSPIGGSGINAFSSGGSESPSVPANSEILGDPNLTDAQRLRLVYTNSGQVPPQRMTWSGLWQLPVGRGKKFLSNTNRAVDAIAGGWQIAFIGTWEGGFWMGNSSSLYQFGNPALSSGKRLSLNFNGVNQLLWFRGYFDPTAATNVNSAALEALVAVNPANRILRPLGSDLANDIPLTVNGVTTNVTVTDMLNPNARNFMLGPGAWNQDLTLFKYFSFAERVKLRMSADFFNAFNHPDLNTPNSSTGLVDLSSQPNQPRIIQLGARLEF